MPRMRTISTSAFGQRMITPSPSSTVIVAGSTLEPLACWAAAVALACAGAGWRLGLGFLGVRAPAPWKTTRENKPSPIRRRAGFETEPSCDSPGEQIRANRNGERTITDDERFGLTSIMRDLMKARPSRQRPIASGKRSRQTLVAAASAGRARPKASIVK